MDKKKLIAGVVVVTAIGMAGYLYLPGLFESEPAPAPVKAPAKASLPKNMPPAPAIAKKEPAPAMSAEEPSPARISRAPAPPPPLPVSSAPRDATDQTVDTLLRQRQILKLETEIKTLTAAANRVEAENKAGTLKNNLEATKAKVELDYIEQHPTQYAQKTMTGQPGPGGATMLAGPLPVPMTNSAGLGGTAMEGPFLRMVSVIGNERSAWIEYRGQMQRVVVGDQVGSWKVKAIGDDSVDIVSGKTTTRLKFALSATPVIESANPPGPRPTTAGTVPPMSTTTGRPGPL